MQLVNILLLFLHLPCHYLIIIRLLLTTSPSSCLGILTHLDLNQERTLLIPSSPLTLSPPLLISSPICTHIIALLHPFLNWTKLKSLSIFRLYLSLSRTQISSDFFPLRYWVGVNQKVETSSTRDSSSLFCFVMMAQKHLHELLKEDQEPFLLNNYISNKRSQLKRPSPKATLQVKKQKPTTTTLFPVNLCKNSCFLSFHNTPDNIRKSPLFEFASPVKSPRRPSNAIFLHIPAKTASLLLEAALRIQKHSKTKPHHKNSTFGLFGSFFKRLRRNRKGEIEGGGDRGKVSVKDILRWDSSIGRRNNRKLEEEENEGDGVGSCEVGFTCSCSAVWSESNEDKSMDMETSSSGHSCDSVEEEAVFVVDKMQKQIDDDDQYGLFRESPFRFVLQRCPSSSGRRTPEFVSPPVSPSRHKKEVRHHKYKKSNCYFGVLI